MVLRFLSSFYSKIRYVQGGSKELKQDTALYWHQYTTDLYWPEIRLVCTYLFPGGVSLSPKRSGQVRENRHWRRQMVLLFNSFWFSCILGHESLFFFFRDKAMCSSLRVLGKFVSSFFSQFNFVFLRCILGCGQFLNFTILFVMFYVWSWINAIKM